MASPRYAAWLKAGMTTETLSTMQPLSSRESRPSSDRDGLEEVDQVLVGLPSKTGHVISHPHPRLPLFTVLAAGLSHAVLQPKEITDFEGVHGVRRRQLIPPREPTRDHSQLEELCFLEDHREGLAFRCHDEAV